jgi:hypothetical protein
VFLKGLFRCATEHSFCPADDDYVPWVSAFDHCSVATTSTKSPAVLKTDMRCVPDRMQVQYRETKTGFDCIHLPSINISSLQDPHRTPTPSSKSITSRTQQALATLGVVRLGGSFASHRSSPLARAARTRTTAAAKATVNGNMHNKEKEKGLLS